MSPVTSKHIIRFSGTGHSTMLLFWSNILFCKLHAMLVQDINCSTNSSNMNIAHWLYIGTFAKEKCNKSMKTMNEEPSASVISMAMATSVTSTIMMTMMAWLNFWFVLLAETFALMLHLTQAWCHFALKCYFEQDGTRDRSWCNLVQVAQLLQTCNSSP